MPLLRASTIVLLAATACGPAANTPTPDQPVRTTNEIAPSFERQVPLPPPDADPASASAEAPADAGASPSAADAGPVPDR